MTTSQDTLSLETIRSGAAELKEKLEEQSELIERSRMLQHETDALEAHKTQWLKDQTKLAKEQDPMFNELSGQLASLKQDPRYAEANLAFKTTKEDLGIPDLEREKNQRGRDLAIQVAQNPDVLEMSALLVEKTKELLDTIVKMDEANAYIRTRGIRILDAAATQLPLF